METEIKICISSFFIFLLAALEHKFKRLHRNKGMGRTHNELKDIIAHKLTQNLNVWKWVNIENLNSLKNTPNMEFICIDVLEWQRNLFEVNISNDTHLSSYF